MISYRTLFLFVVAFTLQYSADCARRNVNNMESFLEYHFHTYFNASDHAQVKHAIQLRNEIIANCVAKKIIAIPLHWHYDPANPIPECKLNYFKSKNRICFMFCILFLFLIIR